jgi:hypothetical protein
MKHVARKMSDIMKEMSQTLLRNPDAVPSSEAAHVALMFANIAWNQCVGLGQPRAAYRAAWEEIESGNPAMWSEFKSTDVEAMLDDLVKYKQKHFPNDQRRILLCGIPNGNVRVEWLPPVKPGIDSAWEVQLHVLVRLGEREQAIRFLQETRRMSRTAAVKRVNELASNIGLV